MFDTELPPPPLVAPPEEVIDCLVEDEPGAAEPVRWSDYIPDGLLADIQTPGWSVTQHPDGCTTWATPSGHFYHSQPPPLTDPEPLPTHPAPDPDQPPPF